MSSVAAHVFNPIDINFFNHLEGPSKLMSFQAVLMHDYTTLHTYLNDAYIHKNITLQTALMLACYVGDVDAVRILIPKEIGHVDLYDRNALWYATHSMNPCQECIELVKTYECQLEMIFG